MNSPPLDFKTNLIVGQCSSPENNTEIFIPNIKQEPLDECNYHATEKMEFTEIKQVTSSEQNFDSNIVIKQEPPDDYDYPSATKVEFDEIKQISRSEQNYDPSIHIKTELPDDYEIDDISHPNSDKIISRNNSRQKSSTEIEEALKILRQKLKQEPSHSSSAAYKQAEIETNISLQSNFQNLMNKTVFGPSKRSAGETENTSRKKIKFQLKSLNLVSDKQVEIETSQQNTLNNIAKRDTRKKSAVELEKSRKVKLEPMSPNSIDNDKLIETDVFVQHDFRNTEFASNQRVKKQSAAGIEHTARKKIKYVSTSFNATDDDELQMDISTMHDFQNTLNELIPKNDSRKKSASEIEAALQILRKKIKSESVSSNSVVTDKQVVRDNSVQHNFKKYIPFIEQENSSLPRVPLSDSRNEIFGLGLTSDNVQHKPFSTEILKYYHLNTKIDINDLVEALKYLSEYPLHDIFAIFYHDSENVYKKHKVNTQKLTSKFSKSNTSPIMKTLIASNTMTCLNSVKTHAQNARAISGFPSHKQAVIKSENKSQDCRNAAIIQPSSSYIIQQPQPSTMQSAVSAVTTTLPTVSTTSVIPISPNQHSLAKFGFQSPKKVVVLVSIPLDSLISPITPNIISQSTIDSNTFHLHANKIFPEDYGTSKEQLHAIQTNLQTVNQPHGVASISDKVTLFTSNSTSVSGFIQNKIGISDRSKFQSGRIVKSNRQVPIQISGACSINKSQRNSIITKNPEYCDVGLNQCNKEKNYSKLQNYNCIASIQPDQFKVSGTANRYESQSVSAVSSFSGYLNDKKNLNKARTSNLKLCNASVNNSDISHKSDFLNAIEKRKKKDFPYNQGISLKDPRIRKRTASNEKMLTHVNSHISIEK